MSDSPFVLNQVGPVMEITLSKGKANAISAEDNAVDHDSFQHIFHHIDDADDKGPKGRKEEKEAKDLEELSGNSNGDECE